MLTAGLSKKVTWPAVALAALGVACLILSALVADATLLTGAGIGLLAAAGVAPAVGYQAPASTTVSEDEIAEADATPPYSGPGSDIRLSADARKAIAATAPPE